MVSHRSIRIPVLIALLGAAVGCETVDLKIEDNDRFTPGGRASYEFYPGVARRREGTLLDLVKGTPAPAPGKTPVTAKSAGVKGTIAIVGEIAAVKGRDHQRLGPGQEAELDTVVVGPAQLRLNSENLRGHLAARGGIRLFDVLSLEAITGIGVDSTTVRMRSGDVDRQDEELRPGFLLGGRATVRPIALFDLYAQYTVNLTEFWTAIQDTDVGAELNLTRNVSVFAGYRWWDFNNEKFNGSSSWELEVNGPTAGVSLKF